MKRLELEIEGVTTGDLYRQMQWIAEQVKDGAIEEEGEYTTGFGDGPKAPYFYRVTELEG